MGYKIREKSSGLFFDKIAKSLGKEGYEWESRNKALNVIRTKTRKKKNKNQYEIVETGTPTETPEDPDISKTPQEPKYTKKQDPIEDASISESVLTGMLEQIKRGGPGTVVTKPDHKKHVCFLMKDHSMKKELDTYIAENPDRVAGFEIRTFDDLRLMENAIQYFPAELIVLSEEVLPIKEKWYFGKSIRTVYYAENVEGLKRGAVSGLKTIGTADSTEKLVAILPNEPYRVLFNETQEEDLERLTIEKIREFLITAKKIEQEIWFTKIAVQTEDLKTQDYLHYIELNDIKPEEESELISKIKTARTIRRKNKDINEVLEIAVNGINKEIIDAALSKLESLSGRIYTPRIENKMFEGSLAVSAETLGPRIYKPMPASG